MRRFRFWLPVVLSVVAISSAGRMASAEQQQPTTTTNTETRAFEVVSVAGNKVVVRGAAGTQEITVTDDYRFTVDGKQVSVKELRPGMKGTARITTTTTVTPVTVTEVKSGEVIQVAGGSITVKTDEGFKMFTEGDAQKRNVTIMRDGKPISFSQLSRGDRLSATIVTSGPPRIVSQREVDAMMTSPAAAAANAASSAARATGNAAAAAAGATANAASSAARAVTGSSGGGSGSTAAAGTSSTRQLPKTASPMPLVGLIGVGLLSVGVLLTVRRRRASV